MTLRRSNGWTVRVLPAFVALPLAAISFGACAAEATTLERGHEVAALYCAGCHAIGRTDASPLADAPPFRTLSRNYPVSDLQEALAEGIVTGHPDMPEVAWDPTTIEVFLAYLESIQEPAGN
jgi:mono/diheme cytochrome c family protein